MSVLAATCATLTQGSVPCTDVSASAMTATCGDYGTFDLSKICPSTGCNNYFTVLDAESIDQTFYLRLQNGGLPRDAGSSCDPNEYLGKVLADIGGGCNTYGDQSRLASWEIVENTDPNPCTYYGGSTSDICMKLTFGQCPGDCTSIIVSCNPTATVPVPPIQSLCVHASSACSESTVFAESSAACVTLTSTVTSTVTSTITTTVTSTATSTISATATNITTTTSVKENSGLSGAAIGGIVGGSVGLVVLIGAGAYVFVKWGQRKKTVEYISYSPLMRGVNF